MEQISFVDLRLSGWEINLVLYNEMILTVYFDQTIDNIGNFILSFILRKTNVEKEMVNVFVFINKNNEKLLKFIL